MHIPANAMLVFGLTGMALSRKRDEEAPFHWSTLSLARLGPALGWTLLIAGLLYGAEIVRTTLSDLPYENAVDNAETEPTIQSIQVVQKALAFDSGNVQALILLGDLHEIRAARAEDEPERAAEGASALEAYQSALKGNPLDDTIRVRLGMTYDVLQRFSEAYLCYEEAVTAQRYNGRFWAALGNHFFKRGLLAKAEHAYSVAATCPHGHQGAAELAKRMHRLLNLGHFLPPTNPAPAPLAPPPASPVSAHTAVNPAPAPELAPSSPPRESAPVPSSPPSRPEPADAP